MSGLRRRFITEKDAEVRRKTQEAEGVTEEPYDARSLYERLQIEKDRKQEEFEAQIALKNRVHRLDEEEVEYLQTLTAKQHRIEEEHEKEVEELLKEAQPTVPPPSGPTQRSLLANAIKRPAGPGESISSQPKKPNLESTDTSKVLNGDDDVANIVDDGHSSPNAEMLPGLADYTDSDSDKSSGSDAESTDVEDAACTLLEVAATRLRKTKSSNSEES